MVDVSIVIPVYRSENILPHLVEQISKVLFNRKFEIILVNDCSPDNSWNSILELKKEYPNIVGVNLSKNFSQHNAIMAGLNHARGETVVMMDDDLQHPPEKLPELIKVINEGKDVCYTNYVKRKHKKLKIVGSKIANYIAMILLDKPKKLYLSSFKAISKSLCEEIIKYSGPYPYIDGLILQATKNYGIIDIPHNDRFEGRSNYSTVKLVSLFIKMATGFSVIPLRVVSYLGFLTFSSGLIYSIYIIINQLFFEKAMQGWSSTMVILLVLGGVQMISLGIIGEYLGRVYLKLNEKPQYIIKDIIS